MPVAKKTIKKATKQTVSSVPESEGGGVKEIVENIAVSMLDQNKDGQVKDDIFRMALDFVKSKFMKK